MLADGILRIDFLFQNYLLLWLYMSKHYQEIFSFSNIKGRY